MTRAKPLVHPVMARLALALSGLGYCVAGLTLLVLPRWFFENVGHPPPFDGPYAGDLGSFVLPVGVALLVAAWRPSRSRGIVLLAAAASVIHGLDRTADALIHDARPTGRLADPLPLLPLGAMLLFTVPSERGGRGAPAPVGVRGKP